MNSYRFVSGQEPSDEMLIQIMNEVAEGTVYINPDKVVKDALATGIRVRLSSAQQTIVRVQRRR